jgi:hypothetical protein
LRRLWKDINNLRKKRTLKFFCTRTRGLRLKHLFVPWSIKLVSWVWKLGCNK